MKVRVIADRKHPRNTFPQEAAKEILGRRLIKLGQFVQNAPVAEEEDFGIGPEDSVFFIQWFANESDHWWVLFMIDVQPDPDGPPEAV